MVYYICHCISLHVYSGEISILDSRLVNFGEFECCVIALSAFFFPFCALGGRCPVIVSRISRQCLPRLTFIRGQDTTTVKNLSTPPPPPVSTLCNLHKLGVVSAAYLHTCNTVL